MMDEPIDGRRGGHRVLEDRLPLRERQVAGQKYASAFVTVGQDAKSTSISSHTPSLT